MPYYYKLSFGTRDSATTRKKKQRVAKKIRLLKSALSAHLKGSKPEKNEGKESVKIATWNLREFGKSNYKGRGYEELYYMAEIISHFDIIALQEIRADLEEFFELKKILGPDWSFIGTDVTDGSPGNGERMIFLFNNRKVQFRDIAGELTLKEDSKIRAAFGERIKLENGLQVQNPNNLSALSGTYEARIETKKDGTKRLAADLEIPVPPNTILELPVGSSLVLTKGTPVTSTSKGKATVTIPNNITGEQFRLRFPENSFDDSLRQFARSPFLISFQSGWLKINLCTVHIYYGEDTGSKLDQRQSEIEQLTAALAAKAKGEFQFDDQSFLGVLGDFNIIGKDHPTMSALESNGFIIPEELKSIPGSNVARDKAYDQIAFWEPKRVNGYVRLEILAANVFDFYEHVFTDEDEAALREEAEETDFINGLRPNTDYKRWRTYKMSDHLPMWIELQTDFSDAYLERIREDD